MKLIVAKALWGMTENLSDLWGPRGSLEQHLNRIAEAGYDAIETPLPPDTDREKLRRVAKGLGLEIIAMVFTQGSDHASSFRSQLEDAARLEPLQVTCHGGRDSMPWDEQRRLFAAMLEAEHAVRLPVAHETHRGRAMFTPWTTAALLRELPDLKVCGDISHWFCVCESTLEDQESNVELAMRRSIHLHGRIGHTQGPQVNDPRAPEHAALLARHERFWDIAIEQALREQRHRFTFTPEFGPRPYMPALPYTCVPVVDLFDVCLFMADRFRKRWELKLR